jgi:hypothetical protein
MCGNYCPYRYQQYEFEKSFGLLSGSLARDKGRLNETRSCAGYLRGVGGWVLEHFFSLTDPEIGNFRSKIRPCSHNKLSWKLLF